MYSGYTRTPELFEKNCWTFGLDPVRVIHDEPLRLEIALALALIPQVKAGLADSMSKCIICHEPAVGLLCASCRIEEAHQAQAELDESQLYVDLRRG